MALGTTQAIDSMSDSSDNEEIDENTVYGYLVRVDENDTPLETYELRRSTVSIGRKKTNHLILTDNTISSNHCEIGM